MYLVYWFRARTLFCSSPNCLLSSWDGLSSNLVSRPSASILVILRVRICFRSISLPLNYRKLNWFNNYCLKERNSASKKEPLSIKKYLCRLKSTYVYEKVYLCLWKGAYAYEKVPMPMKKYLWKGTYLYEKEPMPMKNYLCLWKITYAYEKVSMPMRKYLCLWECTYVYEKEPMPKRRNLSSWKSTYAYEKVPMIIKKSTYACEY